ncbi:hypothetical protein F444_06675 [Phytophthora nicotianae P1976]|uniref:Uncharacterized protein n=1 Tax=Phytophthora nicotianae P1976 TaxID=1317066 RepID=A0A081AHF1_PHYNI|nr:hypothetical protein F444_06675 [Phytophthora nicotianae P1976]
MNELDALYAQANYVVRDMDYKCFPPETLRFTREWSKDITFLETLGMTTWLQDIQDDDNTAARAYRLDFSEDLRYNDTLQIYLTLRRYIEDGRMVIVWRGLAEGRGGVQKPLHGRMRLAHPVACFDLESDTTTRASRFVKLRMRADEVDEADVIDVEQMMAKLMQSYR